MRRARVLGLVVVLAMAGCGSGGSDQSVESPGPSARSESAPAASTTTMPSAVPGAGACRADYTPRALPTWARAGFQPATLPMPYVLGSAGDIVAILWADHDPLTVSPPPEPRRNKILWVARTSDGPLQIRARLAGSGRTVARTVANGPGPSIIDMPAAGCWSFDLSWGDRTDHLWLEYVAS